MNDDVLHVRIFRELPAQQANEFVRRIAVVNRQGTAHAKHACLFPRLDSNRRCHRVLKAGNAFPAVPLFRQADRLLGR